MWDERRLTIAFPVLHDDEVYAVVVVTSAPPLWRFELIETMAAQVADQLALVAERERAQRRPGPRPRPGHGGVPAEVGLPGDHEPRDPDAAQRRDRPQRPAAPDRAHRRAAAARRRRAGGQPGAARADQRHPRLLQDRGRADGARAGRLRDPAAARAGGGDAHRVRARQGARPGRLLPPRRPGGALRRPDPAGPGRGQPGLQRGQVHRARGRDRAGHRGRRAASGSGSASR